MGRDGELKPHPAPDQIAANREKRSAGSARRANWRASLTAAQVGATPEAWDRFFHDVNVWLKSRPCNLRWLTVEDAEDAAQEALATLMDVARRSPHKLSPRYVSKVVRSKTVDSARRLSRSPEREELDDASSVAVAEIDETSNLEAAERRDRLQKACKVLTPKQREFIELRLRGLTYHEIAAEWNTNPAAIRNLAVRARAALRHVLDSEDLF